MKFEIKNNRIYFVTRGYDDFHMDIVDTEYHIPLGTAIRLRHELESVIKAHQQLNPAEPQGGAKVPDPIPGCPGPAD